MDPLYIIYNIYHVYNNIYNVYNNCSAPFLLLSPPLLPPLHNKPNMYNQKQNK